MGSAGLCGYRGKHGVLKMRPQRVLLPLLCLFHSHAPTVLPGRMVRETDPCLLTVPRGPVILPCPLESFYAASSQLLTVPSSHLAL